MGDKTGGDKSDQAAARKSDDTLEFYRVEFFKQRAEIGVEVAKRVFANMRDGLPQIPIEAFGEHLQDAQIDQVQGQAPRMGFIPRINDNKLHQGFEVEILHKGKVVDVEDTKSKRLNVVFKGEEKDWDIRITAPANLKRDPYLIDAMGQALGKEFKKDDFVRKNVAPVNGVPAAEITLNLETFAKAPDRIRVNTKNGAYMASTQEIVEAEQAAKEAEAQAGGGRGSRGSRGNGGGRG